MDGVGLHIVMDGAVILHITEVIARAIMMVITMAIIMAIMPETTITAGTTTKAAGITIIIIITATGGSQDLQVEVPMDELLQLKVARLRGAR